MVSFTVYFLSRVPRSFFFIICTKTDKGYHISYLCVTNGWKWRLYYCYRLSLSLLFPYAHMSYVTVNLKYLNRHGSLRYCRVLLKAGSNQLYITCCKVWQCFTCLCWDEQPINFSFKYVHCSLGFLFQLKKLTFWKRWVPWYFTTDADIATITAQEVFFSLCNPIMDKRDKNMST